MTERERLARVFGIEPMRPLGALAGAAAMNIIPMGWIFSATIVFGVAALYANEDSQVRAGLREVDSWGFAVTNYRGWLLASAPAFDIELRRDVAIELLEASIRSVDPTIVVERKAERVVRVIMRPIEVRSGEETATFLAGDRMRLAELHARVLAPLHADVGIAAMRMGDHDTLTALVAAPANASTAAAFRDQAMVAPPDLQSLAHAGTSQPRPPREAKSLQLRTDRLLYATNQRPAPFGVMGAGTLGLAILGVAFAPIGGLVGIAAGGAIAAGMRMSDRQKVERALAAVSRWPFPVDGYDDWLLSGRPICDIEFASPPRRDEVERDLRGIARVAELTWLTNTLVRLESQSVMHIAAQAIPSFWGGNPRELSLLARRVLIPLHDSVGIVAVRMGGYLDRRV
jgi:hypothetical protein